MLNHQGTVTLETERLILREYREGEEQIKRKDGSFGDVFQYGLLRSEYKESLFRGGIYGTYKK